MTLPRRADDARPGTGDARELDEFTLERARRGDADACRKLVEIHQYAVFALLGRMLMPRDRGGLVEDLAQETFLRVFKALPRFEPRGPARLSTWILTIASRLALQELKRKRAPIAGGADVDAVAVGEGTRADPGRAWTGRAIMSAVRELTEEQQAVFVLREFHGLDDEEIGRALGLEPGAVRARMLRARARLRQALTEVDHG